MVSMIFLSATAFFAVTGVYMLFREIFRTRFCPYPERIVLRVRNCEDEIEYTLRALLLQYPKSRIIVEDNLSADSTAEIARRFAKTHSRVHIRSVKNDGSGE